MVSWNTCIQFKALTLSKGHAPMASDGCESDFLPDLPDEKTGEQLVLEQKVFRTNELFIQRHREIVEWLFSPEEYRKYPNNAKRNKYGF